MGCQPVAGVSRTMIVADSMFIASTVANLRTEAGSVHQTQPLLHIQYIANLQPGICPDRRSFSVQKSNSSDNRQARSLMNEDGHFNSAAYCYTYDNLPNPEPPFKA